MVALLLVAPAGAVEKAAIDKSIAAGVKALRNMQRADGTWPHTEIGATALAALTMLECGVRESDPAIKKAAAKVRQASPSCTHTYSLALSVLFLDRLGAKSDTPLIESMVVRLLAGQLLTGGWSYSCPGLGPDEVKRLLQSADGERTLVGGRDLNKLPARGKRTTKDLPREIQVQLDAIRRGAMAAAASGVTAGDNSNSQFAVLALWVGRRYGLPVHDALRRSYDKFRKTQNPDGGWGYSEFSPMMVAPAIGPRGGGAMGSRPTMTCAGLLGLACGHGTMLDKARAKDEDAKRDVSKDANMKLALRALATVVGAPRGGKGPLPSAGGKAYYFFWSLERAAVTLNLDTIGGKDWYNWGAEILLANQLPDGSWRGEYGGEGADTCFALLFLRRSNLVRDLSSGLTGLKGGRDLRAGGVGGGGLKGSKESLGSTGIGDKDTKPSRGSGSTEAKKGPPDARVSGTKPPVVQRPREDTPSGKLARDLVNAPASKRGVVLAKLREGKGVVYTEALAAAIPRLDADSRRKARDALGERLTRMKPTTLRNYLKDEDAELRRAAALATAAKESKVLIPDLIRLLSDPEGIVERAAYAALKDMTGKDFGPRAGADRRERSRAIAAWEMWWRKQARE
jgi:hypothetical protein